MEKKQTLPSQQLSAKKLLNSIVAIVVAFLLLLSVISVAQKYFGIRKHIKDLENEKVELQQKQVTLKATNEYLATPEGAEQALRDKFNVTKPGEGIIMVTPPDMATAQPSQSKVLRWWDAVLRGLGIRKNP